MEKSKIRLDEPILISYRKPRKRKIKHFSTGSDAKRYPHLFKYTELSPERKEKKIKTVVTAILKRRKKSVRFRKLETRIANSRPARCADAVKTCSICGITRGHSFFDLQRDKTHKKTYRRSYCMRCRKKMNAAAYQRRKQKELNGNSM